MKLILIMLITNLYSQELIRFCFKKPTAMKQSKAETKQFLLGEEKILGVNSQCYDILVHTSSRTDFLKDFISMRHGGIYKTASSSRTSKSCDINVEKVTQTSGKSREAVVKRRNLKFQDTTTKGSSTETSFLKVSSGKSASLTINDQTINLTCTYISENSYRLKFSLAKTTVQFGTIIINGRPLSYPASSQSEGISTTLELSRGQRIQIGSSSKNKNNKGKSVGIGGIDYNKSRSIGNSNYYLSIR
jgi:hypothetical protein